MMGGKFFSHFGLGFSELEQRPGMRGELCDVWTEGIASAKAGRGTSLEWSRDIVRKTTVARVD